MLNSRRSARLLLLLCAALAIPATADAQGCNFTDPHCYESSAEAPKVMIGTPWPEGAQRVEVRIYYSDDNALSTTAPQVSITNGSLVSHQYVFADPVDRRSSMSKLTIDLVQGQNTVTAQIADALGQVSSASRAFGYVGPPIPAPQSAPVVSAAPQNGVNRDLATCDGCSEAVLAYSTPAYVSLDQPRGITLFYSSSQAAPIAFIQLDVTDPSSQPADYFSVRLKTPSGAWVTLSNGQTDWYFQRGAGVNRLAVQFDAASFATGSHAFTAEVTSHWGSTTMSTSQPIRVAIIDEKSSPYGAGWSIAGLQRLHPVSGGAAITSGDGRLTYFTKTCSTPCTYNSPAGDFSVLEDLPGGGWRRRYPDGSYVTFGATHKHIASAVDRFGNTTLFAYNGSHQLTSVTDPAGKVIQLGYSNGRLATITDPTGRVSSVTHTGSPARLSSITNPAGGTALTVAYDATGRMTGWSDARQGLWNVGYGFAARVDSILAPAVQTASGLQRPVTRVRSLESRVLMSGSVGTLASKRPVVSPDSAHVLVTSPGGAQERLWPDAFGLATRLVDAEGRASRFDRNHHGLVEYAEDPDGNVQTASYGHGDYRVTAATRRTAGGLVQTQVDYHYPSGLPMTVTTGGIATHFAYLANGAIDSVYVGNLRTKYDTDARGRVKSIRDSEGNVSTVEYLSSGSQNTYRLTSPEGRTQTFGYDAAGRTTSVTGPDNTVTSASYDPLNRVQSVTQPGSLTTMTYYTVSRPEADSVRDAKGQIRRFQYNAHGWPISETNALDDTLSFAYDIAGNVRQRTDAAGRTVTATYDALRRLSTRTVGGATTTYAYDPGRTWASASNPVSSDFIYFHANGQVDSTSTERPGISPFRINYRYNDLGQVDQATLVRATDTLSVGYSFDELGRLRAIRDILTRGQYDPYAGTGYSTSSSVINFNGRSLVSQVTLGNAAGRGTVNFGYTPDGQLQQSTVNALGGTALTRRYTYTGRGQMLKRQIPDPVVHPDDHDLRQFAYDTRGQLTGYQDFNVAHEENCPWNDPWNCTWDPVATQTGSATFPWDAVGNPTGSGRAVNDANRLTAYDGWTFYYDNAGYLTDRSKAGVLTQSLYWNALGQLDSVTTSGSGTVRFQYDGFGRRVTRVAPNGAVTRYVYDGDHVFVETDGTGTLKRAYSYYPGVDQPHSVREFNSSYAGTYYYTLELPGHVNGLVRSDGVVVNRYRYSGFGKPEQVVEGVPNSLRFMAREWDPDARLYYVRNRWYDPEVGRFISEDPIGIAGGINLYVYVENDPINSLDPYGLVGGSCVAVLQTINLHPDVIKRICGGTTVLPTVNVVYRWPFGTPRNDGRSPGFGNRPSIVRFVPEFRYLGQIASDPGRARESNAPDAAAQSACTSAAPMSGSSNYPYPAGYTYLGVNANYMFERGGNGAWGQSVRGCLVCMYKGGTGASAAHDFCYANANAALPWYSSVRGYGTAVPAAGIYMFGAYPWSLRR